MTVPTYVEHAHFILHDAEPPDVDPPTNPARYDWSDKAIEREVALFPVVTRAKVGEAMERGKVYRTEQDQPVFVYDDGGVAIYIVVQRSDDWRLVTIWAYVHDRRRALLSGRTEEQIEQVYALTG